MQSRPATAPAGLSGADTDRPHLPAHAHEGQAARTNKSVRFVSDIADLTAIFEPGINVMVLKRPLQDELAGDIHKALTEPSFPRAREYQSRFAWPERPRQDLPRLAAPRPGSVLPGRIAGRPHRLRARRSQVPAPDLGHVPSLPRRSGHAAAGQNARRSRHRIPVQRGYRSTLAGTCGQRSV